ncbi:MAG: hypothetical protein ACTSV7_11610 [Candidatus Baldrarchaeia archaeon]
MTQGEHGVFLLKMIKFGRYKRVRVMKAKKEDIGVDIGRHGVFLLKMMKSGRYKRGEGDKSKKGGYDEKVFNDGHSNVYICFKLL